MLFLESPSIPVIDQNHSHLFVAFTFFCHICVSLGLGHGFSLSLSVPSDKVFDQVITLQSLNSTYLTSFQELVPPSLLISNTDDLKQRRN